MEKGEHNQNQTVPDFDSNQSNTGNANTAPCIQVQRAGVPPKDKGGKRYLTRGWLLLDYIHHHVINTEIMPSDSCFSYTYNQVSANDVTTSQTCCFRIKGEGKESQKTPMRKPASQNVMQDSCISEECMWGPKEGVYKRSIPSKASRMVLQYNFCTTSMKTQEISHNCHSKSPTKWSLVGYIVV